MTGATLKIDGSLARNVSSTFASNLVCLALGFVSSVLLNRTLGPEGKGLYAALLTTSQLLLLVASFGIGKSVTFYLAGKEHSPAQVWQSFLALTGGAALLLVLLLALLGWLDLPHVALAREHRPFLLVLCLCSMVHSFGIGALRGLRLFGACNYLGVVTNAAFVVLVVTMAGLRATTAHAAAMGKALAYGCVIVLMVSRLRTEGLSLRPQFHPGVAKKIVTYGIGFFFYNLFQNLNYRFDLILVVNMTSLADAGWYSTGTGLSELIWYFPNAIGTVLFPLICGARDRQSNMAVAQVCRWSLLVMSVGVVLLVATAPAAIALLYGEQFRPAARVIYALAPGIITNGFFQILGVHLAARKQLRTLTWITGTGFVVNLLLNVIFIPRWGIVGAGLASSISYSVSGALCVREFTRRTGLAWTELIAIPRDEFAAALLSLTQYVRGR